MRRVWRGVLLWMGRVGARLSPDVVRFLHYRDIVTGYIRREESGIPGKVSSLP